MNVVLDEIEWKSTTVDKDGILDILLSQKEADVNGLRAYLHLGMYTSVAYPAAGIYPVNGTEDDGTFSASLGRYGNVLIPCYLMLADEEGWAHAIWYSVNGTINLTYDENSQPVLSGECGTWFGSTIRFAYHADTQGIEIVEDQKSKVESRKHLRERQLIIIRDGKEYDALGRLIVSQIPR